jgi:hypothetical protein
MRISRLTLTALALLVLSGALSISAAAAFAPKTDDPAATDCRLVDGALDEEATVDEEAPVDEIDPIEEEPVEDEPVEEDGFAFFEDLPIDEDVVGG